MIKVSGRIVVKESGLGVSNLPVFVWDVESQFDIESISQAPDMVAATRLIEPQGQRVGSTATNSDGRFDIEWPTPEPSASVRRPNLVLLVATPEERENKGGQLLYASPTVRSGIGPYETLLVKLDRTVLEEAGVLHPFHARAADSFVASARLRVADEAGIRRDLTEAAAATVRDAREERKRFKEFEGRFLESISRLPRAKLHGDLFVGRGEDIEATNRKAIESGITTKVNGAKRKTRFYLFDAQREALKNTLSADNTIDFKTLRSILTDGEPSDGLSTPQLLRHSELILQCLKRTREEDRADELLDMKPAAEEEGDDEVPEPGDVGGAGIELTISDGLPAFVARFMDTATSPEEAVSFGLPPDVRRPSQGDVQQSIDGFSMRPGPADRPTFFDFHSLQIAFDHVWQELVSDDVLEVAEALHNHLRDMGADPDAPEHAGRNPLEIFREEAAVVEATLRHRENPTVMYMRPRGEMGGPPIPTGDPANLGTNSGIYIDETPPENGGIRTPPGGPSAGPHTGGEFFYPTPLTLLQRLQALLNTPYAFTVFGANSQEHSVNFGIVVTYRHEWDPINYQVGDMVKTITLLPKESRKIRRELVLKRKRAVTEVEKASSVRKDEFSQTSRAETEIMRKAKNKTNFNLSTEGTYDIGIAEGTAETTAGRDAERDSAETKKDFREAVIKASQEYKQERTIEIDTEVGEELEETVTGEITNPNDELAVTFMLYELQRVYRIHEEIHRVTPVVLVAQEVPKFSDITDAWLIAHDWILKRALLDDSFRPTLDYLSTGYEGDRRAMAHLAVVVEVHRKIVEELRDDLVVLKRKEGVAYGALQGAIEERADQVRKNETESFWHKAGEFFGLDDKESPEAARILEEAARDAIERATVEVKQLTMRLEREVTAYNAASERYQKVLSEHGNWQVRIERLKLHIKQNILYYMQAIWVHEVPDQRYFRLFQVKVPAFEDTGSQYTLIGSPGEEVVISTLDGAETATAVDFEITPTLSVQFGQQSVKSLVEVADLDKLLGFKGNYMIFPLKESNELTDIMMDPYVTAGFGDVLSLIDPDEAGNMNRRDFAKYVICLRDALGEEGFNDIKEALKSQYKRILQAASRPGEEIVVPTGSLFIEALPATHPLLEDFKLMHRAVDVKKAQAEVRHAELENLRAAARLLASEEHIALLEDADIEKKIVIEGASDHVIVAPGDE